ncbi:proteasome ATPase [Candidatus Nitronereus thalassa]|uniref:Proteasome ATPase n=1 Tax=Candidatus Nitronereus thalassa TaxID=3020898 RepID=A0ABU3K3H9_9BACT|nr:proteasome ATPase [Candidatus Nitronereus thalassa]MDT7040914.1 proteasome ATPase [Candidatus Nitronereus thalassa]
MGFRKHEDYDRELEKLRGELQSLERETRQLYDARIKLQQTQKQNEKLATTLQEAKTQIESLRAEIEKLTAPPSAYALFSSLNDDRTANVYISGRKMRVSVHDSIVVERLQKGQEVILNEAMNIIEARGFDPQGQVVRLKDRLDDIRALVQLHHDEERVVELGEPLLHERLSVGDHLLFDARSGYVIEKIPKSEIEELVIEEVPDIGYEDVGGLAKEVEHVTDAVELPFLHPDLFLEHKLTPPKGVLLYGPPGCGKTMIAKAVANSIAKKLQHLSGKDVRSYFLHIKGPELLNKYVGESERQIREVFSKARDKAATGNPVIVFFDEMDALFRTRGSGISSDIESTIVPQFLAEIDGVERLQNVIVIGASNRQDLIDPAVLRPGRLDVKVKIPRPDKYGAKDIFAKYLVSDLPLAKEEVDRYDGDRKKVVDHLIDATVESMYALSEENRYLEVTYANGEKETLYFKDFSSGALIEGVVSRAKKSAVKRTISTGEKGIKEEDLLRAIRDEFKAHEDLPNTTNPDDWARIAGKKGEKIIHVRTLTPGSDESREIETVSAGHYF